ncbi:hypothetical protein [Alcanivorax sp.]|uniref:hypothetical protein n=1 Tax=Alcanivorax sp. TaxID=1872427 RepID=UPI0025C2A833|nr:hypothetical protein [Alcanivorax sp.]
MMAVGECRPGQTGSYQRQQGRLRPGLLAGLLIAACASAYWLLPLAPAAPAGNTAAGVTAGTSPDADTKVDAAATPAALPMIDTVAERSLAMPEKRADNAPAAVPTPSPQAVAALRQSMRNGDPRTPPLVRNTDLREPPSAAELADPALYQQYEARQNQAVRASFVAAANRKMAELEGLIARGKEFGIAPEQLEEGIAKLDKLREQRDQLVAQYPELAAEEGAAEAEDAEGAEGAGDTSQD